MEFTKRQFALSCACLFVTLAATAMTVWHFIAAGRSAGDWRQLGALLFFAAIVLLLVYGSLVHQSARAAYFARLQRHKPVSRRVLEQMFARQAEPLAVIIPSYKEELPVLWMTILSAALVEYPERRVTVLLDDPPRGSDADISALNAARKMIESLDLDLADAARPFQGELEAYVARKGQGLDLQKENERLARLNERAACQLENWAAASALPESAAFAHVSRFFLEAVFHGPAAEHRRRAAALAAGEFLDDVECEYRRLAARFAVSISSFERKQFANLSHAPNKAMNLNAYIGLIGGHYRAMPSPSGPMLVACAPEEADLAVPHAEYLLTLDADSVVLSDYALRLVHILEADPKIGVAQTPYSAFPGTSNVLERIAGATTDIQYVLHQGFTACRASYWVGANALLRYRALLDIRTETMERGYRVPIFIQDRTVIEDTGSTIDLIRRGWSLHNYPERLAYSATPPDFGSLVIQRRRWSNGGLLILPDLVRFCFGPADRRASAPEAFMRLHYLVSPAIANFGLLALLLLPFDTRFTSIFLPLSAVPYYFIYGRDLKLNGYRWSDLLRIYGLNLLLLPVNLAGVLASIRQAITGRKSAFGRTPKIEGRTATPAAFLVFQFAAVAYLTFSAVSDVILARYFNAGFSALNAGLMAYGLHAFIGIGAAVEDLRAALRRTSDLPAAIAADAAPAEAVLADASRIAAE